VDLPSIPADAGSDVPEVMQRIGNKLVRKGLDWSEAIRDAEDTAQVSMAMANAGLQMADLRQSTLSGELFNTDPESARMEWARKAKEIGTNLENGLRSDRAKQYFQLTFPKTLTSHAISIGDDVARKRADIAKGAGLSSIVAFQESAARADTQSVLENSIRQGYAAIDGGIASGVFKYEDREHMRRSFTDNLFKTRISGMALQNPNGALKELETAVASGMVSADLERQLGSYIRPLLDAQTSRQIADEAFDVGALSRRFESGGNPGAVGYDSVGGTSYGTYQIASKTGTFRSFVDFLKDASPDIHGRLAEAGDPNTGSAAGELPKVWKQIAREDPGRFERLQHDFIEKTHYEPARRAILEKTGYDIDRQPEALKQVLWSTATGHGSVGAAKIFDKALSEAGTEDASRLIRSVYEIRKTQYGGSTPEVRSAVQGRYDKESRLALSNLGQSVPSSQAGRYESMESFVRSRAEEMRPGDAVYADHAVSQFRQEWNVRKQVERMRVEENKDVLTRAIVDPNGPKTVAELLSDPARAAAYSELFNSEPGAVQPVLNALEGKARRKDPDTSARRYYELLNLASGDEESRKAFELRDLLEDYPQIEDGRWHELVVLQNNMKAGKKDVQIETARQSINREIGVFFPEKNAPKSDAEKQAWDVRKANAFVAIEEAVKEEIKQNKNKPLSPGRVSEISRGFLSDMVIEGTGVKIPLFGATWGANKGKLFERADQAVDARVHDLSQIPEHFRQEAERRKRANQKVTAHFDPRTRKWYLLADGNRVDYLED
jgi:hypothetical protein